MIAGRGAPLNFFIANDSAGIRPYKFGFGAAPQNVNSAIGGAGPLIINKLPYGNINKYKKCVTSGRTIGQPTPENAKNLTQRSNATFDAFTKHGAAPRTGITTIAHNATEKKLIIIVHPDNSGDIPLPELRNKLLSIGCDNAIFLDGSDSSMLMVESKFYARPGHQCANKNMHKAQPEEIHSLPFDMIANQYLHCHQLFLQWCVAISLH